MSKGREPYHRSVRLSVHEVIAHTSDNFPEHSGFGIFYNWRRYCFIFFIFWWPNGFCGHKTCASLIDFVTSMLFYASRQSSCKSYDCDNKAEFAHGAKQLVCPHDFYFMWFISVIVMGIYVCMYIRDSFISTVKVYWCDQRTPTPILFMSVLLVVKWRVFRFLFKCYPGR